MRLTLDLDNVNENYARKKAALCAMIFPGKRIEYRMSSSGKGAHIRVFQCGLSWEECCQYRYILGDHLRRIHIDCQRPRKPKQVLFSKKNNNKAGIWMDVPKPI